MEICVSSQLMDCTTLVIFFGKQLRENATQKNDEFCKISTRATIIVLQSLMVYFLEYRYTIIVNVSHYFVLPNEITIQVALTVVTTEWTILPAPKSYSVFSVAWRKICKTNNEMRNKSTK